MRAAETADFDGVPFRVVGAVHLAAIALSVGRAKDLARVLALLECGAVSVEAVRDLAQRHGLHDAWARFRSRFIVEKLCAVPPPADLGRLRRRCATCDTIGV